MADDFDKELEQAPEGSILAPIFIGCGAMSIGCLFSVGIIVVGFLLFAPGIVSTIMDMGGNPMLEEALPLLEANEEVVAALGTPIEAELDDLNEAPGAELDTIQIGDEVEILAVYDLVGPNGTGRLEAVGTRALVAEDEWEIGTLTVILDGGRTIRVFPVGAPDVPAVPTGEALPTPDMSAAPEGEAAEEETPAETDVDMDDPDAAEPAEGDLEN